MMDRKGGSAQEPAARRASGEDEPVTVLFCPHCGYAPLIVSGGPLTQANLDRIRIHCPGCAWPFDREEIARIVERQRRRSARPKEER